MSSREVIYLDFDKTLFDVSRYINQQVFPALADQLGERLERIQELGAQYHQSLGNSTLFSPPALVRFISLQVGKPGFEAELEATFHRADLIESSLFPEVSEVVERLSDEYTLRIFSQGVVEWQREKIEKSGVYGFFDQENSIISSDKTSSANLAQISPEAWVVDDMAQFLLRVRTRTENVVLMARSGQTHRRPQPVWDGLTIASLSELVTLLAEKQS